MGEPTVAVLPVLVAQAASELLLALLLAGVFFHFHRAYRHTYLRHWALSWLAFAFFLLASAASGGTLVARVPGPRLAGLTFVVVVAGYLQIVWLLLGAWELARAQAAGRRTAWLAAGGAVAVGLAALAAGRGGHTTGTLLGLRVVGGVSYLAAAATIVLWRRRLTLGRGLAGLALFLYAIDQLVVVLSFGWRASQQRLVALLMSFDVMVVALLGLALVVWLLEGERERLERAGVLARRRESVQACAYAISEAVRAVRDLPQLYRSIHESLQAVLPARNFYVALRDPASGLVSFPYFADEHDPIPPARQGRGLTEYVLRTGRPLLATPEVIEDLHARGEIERVVRGRVDWLGAPLLERGQVIGVAAIQTHDPTVRLGPAERDLFVFVAAQISSAIEAKRAEEALRQSEARLRQVMDLVPHFIFAKDSEGRYVLANRAVAELYSTTVEHVVGRTDTDLARSQEEARRFRQDDMEVIASGRPKLVPEEPITDSNGRLRYLQTTKIPFSSSGTGRPAILGVSIDITERKKAEETVLRAAKEESLSVLAGGIAHDFNNLLAAILGHASLALKQLPAANPARHHVEKAAGAVERAADLTRQMLAYSGRGHFVVRPMNLNALIRENLPLLRVAVPKSVRLAERLDDDLPSIDADVGQIQQVLMNLVINAAEAIGEGGGAVMVATGTCEVAAEDRALWRASGQPLAPGPYVSLEVRDDGPGLPPDTGDRIFEPFFTTKATGRGLGLAAVLGVVRGHRGALSVESTPGAGTVFRLLFAPSSARAGTAGAGAAPRVAGSRRLCLLLIDDEQVVRDMVGDVLEHEDITVLRVPDGARGVELFRERFREIDVVLLDLSMPGLSGEATYLRLQEIDPAVRVILSSGYDHDEALRRFGEKGPAGFIQKPYRPQQLLSEIDRCLGHAGSSG